VSTGAASSIAGCAVCVVSGATVSSSITSALLHAEKERTKRQARHRDFMDFIVFGENVGVIVSGRTIVDIIFEFPNTSIKRI